MHEDRDTGKAADSREGDRRTNFSQGSGSDAHEDTSDDPGAYRVRHQFTVRRAVYETTVERQQLDSLHKAAGPPL